MSDIVTPCHGKPPMPHYGHEGRAYMQERVLDGYMCPVEGCYNEWDEDGVADKYNKADAPLPAD